MPIDIQINRKHGQQLKHLRLGYERNEIARYLGPYWDLEFKGAVCWLSNLEDGILFTTIGRSHQRKSRSNPGKTTLEVHEGRFADYLAALDVSPLQKLRAYAIMKSHQSSFAEVDSPVPAYPQPRRRDITVNYSSLFTKLRAIGKNNPADIAEIEKMVDQYLK